MTILHAIALGCLCLLVLAIPVDGLVAGGLPLVKMTGLLGFGMTGLLLVNGIPLRGMGWFILLCVLYICWVMASFWWTGMPVDYLNSQAVNSQQSLKANLYLLGVVLLMFQLVRSERDLVLVSVSFLLGCGVLIALFLSSYEPGARTVRHGLEGLDANEMSIIISIGIPLAVYLLLHGGFLLWQLIGLVYLPLAMLTVLATGSRTGLIVMSVSALSLLPLFLKAGLVLRLLSVVVLSVALVWVLSMIPQKTIDRLMSTGTELSKGTLSERSITWQKAWLEFRQQPLTGQGLGSFRQLMSKHNVEYTAHNSYVSIAVEQGLFGLLLYLAVILAVLYQCLVYGGGRRWLFVPLLLVLLLGQMTLMLHENMYVWLAYMLVMLMALLQREQRYAAEYTSEAAYAS